MKQRLLSEFSCLSDYTRLYPIYFSAKLLNFNSNYILDINGLLNQFGGVGFHVK